jgi:outer membrane receptor protein involved in Fe transport
MKRALVCVIVSLSMVALVRGAVTGSVRGEVEDPGRRPVPGAEVVLKAVNSEYSRAVTTGMDGTFEATSLPVGMYRVTVTQSGFVPSTRDVTVLSGGAPLLHFRLALRPVREEVNVSESAAAVSLEEIGPVTMVGRDEIADTPGAALSNSLNAITVYVPGATVTHDQLHVRGGHQVTWAIDGVPIPNTNIASNVGPQIDPKDIDYLEAERGGYSAAYGDRTFGVFNVIPRTGFEGHNTGELFTTFGTFHQTNDQVSFGSHTDKFAYFGSINGNRSDYGLETPGPDVIHDRVWGLGGMGTLVYNRDAFNQFRFVTGLRRDDYQVPIDPADEIRRDMERERDGLANFSWLRTMPHGVLLTVSPFYHQNRADYDGAPEDFPVSPTQHRDSRYAGAQVTLSAVTARHNASAGVYGFFQRDAELVALAGPELSIRQDQRTSGGLAVGFLEDQFKPFSWLTLNAGARLTHFTGTISENAASPRLGAAVRIPRLNWTVRGFWGRYYQAPPLSTVSGPLLDFALSQGFAFIPLQGERDRETQFGVSIPLRGWSLDVNHYHQSARNYFDHNAIAGSNVFFPLTIDRARLRGWEASLRSPRLLHRATLNLTYARAYAEGAGAISGGLTDFSPPETGYFFLDHDQRDTFRSSFDLSLPFGFSAAGALYYGSGFTDGESEIPAHLPGHTTFDGSVSKRLTESLTLSVNALNAWNRRFLLDNSETFGGTHYADPRQIYVQVRYRFHY